MKICKKCNQEFDKSLLSWQNFKNGTKHLREECPNCRSFIRFAVQPLDLNSVDEFVFTFGKFKGKKISEVDHNYLSWCANNFDNNLGEKIRNYCNKNKIKYGN